MQTSRFIGMHATHYYSDGPRSIKSNAHGAAKCSVTANAISGST
jgi:hypothetical protein